MKGPSPLVGYNTNVRHRGKVYHIQTEDSGLSRPHIITHLFADGGRIVSSRKSDYAAHVGREDYAGLVKKMMQDQHKAMFIALHQGDFDAELGETTGTVSAPHKTTAAGGLHAPTAGERRTLDAQALEQAAAAAIDGGTPGKYQATRPTKSRPSMPPVTTAPTQTQSIFGADALSEKSLDEVILSYLAEDLDGDEL